MRLLGVCTVCTGVFTWYAAYSIDAWQENKDHFGHRERTQHINTLQNQVEMQRLYAEVATWNLSGNKWTGYFGVATPVQDWAKKFQTQYRDGKIVFQCKDEALVQYKNTMKKNPLYPFPYVIIAGCLKGKGNKSWKDYAEKGLHHLQGTTQILAHHPDHDRYFTRAQELLTPERVPAVVKQ